MTNPIPDPQPSSFIDLLRISDRRYAPKQGSEEYISQEQVEELHAAIGEAQSASEEAKRYRDSVWGAGAEQAVAQAVNRYQSLAQQAVDNRVSVWEHERGDRIYAPITGSTVYATKREYSEIIDAWNEAKEYADIARDNADASGQAQVFAGQAEQSSLSASRSAQEARDARPQWAGEWESTRDYSYSAFVSYEGVTYYALGTSSGRRPDTNPEYWQAVAERGAPGIVVSSEPPKHGEVWLNPSGETEAFDLEGAAKEAAENALSSKSDVGHTHTLNDIVDALFSDSASPNGIAKRDAAGQLPVPSTPTRDDFAASKIYVDNAKREAIDQANVISDQVNDKLNTVVEEIVKDAGSAAAIEAESAVYSLVNQRAEQIGLVSETDSRLSLQDSGSPQGREDGQVGTVYGDVESGTVYTKTTPVGEKDGWLIVGGDTGWRSIDKKNNSGGNPNELLLRRVGSMCHARVLGQPGWEAAETITFVGTPAGFKHELGRFHDNAYGCSAPIVTNIGNGQPTDCGRIAYRLWVSEEIQVRITNNGSRYWVAELSWFTSDDWPESLPGVPA